MKIVGMPGECNSIFADHYVGMEDVEISRHGSSLKLGFFQGIFSAQDPEADALGFVLARMDTLGCKELGYAFRRSTARVAMTAFLVASKPDPYMTWRLWLVG